MMTILEYGLISYELFIYVRLSAGNQDCFDFIDQVEWSDIAYNVVEALLCLSECLTYYVLYVYAEAAK
jgi:hypothetical protein